MSIINTKQTVRYVIEQSNTFDLSTIDEDAELTLEEYIDIQNLIIENMIDMDLIEEEYEEFLEEEANLQYSKRVGVLIVDYRKAHKEFRKAVKAKDYRTAHTYIKEMKNIVNTFESEIKSIDSSVLSTIIGNILNAVLVYLELLIPSFLIIIGKKMAGPGLGSTLLGGIKQAFKPDGFDDSALKSVENDFNTTISAFGTTKGKIGRVIRRTGKIMKYVGAVIITIREIRAVVQSLKAGEGVANSLNLYRNKLLMCAKQLKKWIDHLDSSLKEKENAERNGEE